VIWPFSADFRLAVGAFRLTRLKALVASPRSWNVNRSKWKSRNTRDRYRVTGCTQIVAWSVAVGSAGADATHHPRPILRERRCIEPLLRNSSPASVRIEEWTDSWNQVGAVRFGGVEVVVSAARNIERLAALQRDDRRDRPAIENLPYQGTGPGTQDPARPGRIRVLLCRGCSRRTGQRQGLYALRDMVSMTKGKHALNFGGELSLEKNMIVSNLDNFGILNFASSAHGKCIGRLCHRPGKHHGE